MPKPPAPYSRARVVTTLVTSTIWFILLYVLTAFAGGGRHQHMSRLEMANVVGLGLLFVPYLATHGVLMGMFKRVLDGSISVPEVGSDVHAAPGIDNPWRLAAFNAFAFGLLPAAIGYLLAMRADVETMTRGIFATCYALAGALLCALVVWVVSGQPFLRTIRKPREKRGFLGTPDQYLLQYFTLPHGVLNAIINGALAFALSTVPFGQPGAVVPAKQIIGDTVVALLILTLLLAGSARSQARNDTLLGIAPLAAASKKSVLFAWSSVLGGGIAFAVVVAVVFIVTKSPGLDVFSWAAYRAVVFGVYAAMLTKVVARAAINSTASNAASSERTAQPSAAA